VVTTNTTHEHVWSALALNRGRLYVSVASYCDKGPYNGKIFLINTSRPTVTKDWYVIDPAVHSGGGIWGPGGVSINPADTNVYTTTGNALGQIGYLGYAEHIVRLTWDLNVLASNYPVLEGQADLDFAATPALYQPPGCPLMAAAKNKNGEVLVYNTDDIDPGPFQRFTVAGSLLYNTFQGDVAYDPTTNMVYLANSVTSDNGQYTYGMLGFNVLPDCTLSLAWGTPVGIETDVTTSPMVANGVVYYSDGSGNQVTAFDERIGAILWDSGSIIQGGMYQAPTVVNGTLYVDARDNVLYAFGL
jgi:DNA-binding beta-propeller fold protein YncE